MTLNQRSATKAYANIGIQTRGAQHDQYELALLMFEAVLENTTAARGAIEDGNIAAKAQHLHKAVRVLQDGLRTSLDLDNGGELAQNLANLYDYCILRLAQANADSNAAAAAEVIGLIRPVADAWKQMREQPESGSVVPLPDSGNPEPSGNPPFSGNSVFRGHFGGSLLAGA